MKKPSRQSQVVIQKQPLLANNFFPENAGRSSEPFPHPQKGPDSIDKECFEKSDDQSQNEIEAPRTNTRKSLKGSK